MPYPNPCVKVVIAGTLPGSEVWATSFGLSLPGSALSQTDLNTLAANCGTAFINNFWNTVKTLFAPSVSATKLTAYQYTGGSTAALVADGGLATVSGSSTGIVIPNQCALVATLKTGLPGRSMRGRMYLPGPTLAAGVGPQQTVANVTIIANALASMFGALKSDPTPGPYQVGVISVRRGAITPVKSLTIDTRYDVQRRRANKQAATGSFTATF